MWSATISVKAGSYFNMDPVSHSIDQLLLEKELKLEDEIFSTEATNQVEVVINQVGYTLEETEVGQNADSMIEIPEVTSSFVDTLYELDQNISDDYAEISKVHNYNTGYVILLHTPFHKHIIKQHF